MTFTTPLDATFEIFIDGAWMDITSDVYDKDEVQITRGRRDEGSQVQPGQVTLTINNKDGRFSPRNPLSPLFGLIGRNTPLRVRVGADVRFSGEVPAWPQRWDTTGRDVWVPIEAAGILRRLGQGQPPVKSPLAVFVPATPLLAAYWPMEDQAGSTRLASGIDGLDPIKLTGAPEPGTADMAEAAGSAPLPVFGQNSAWAARVPPFPVADNRWTVGFLFRFTGDTISGERTIIDMSLGGNGVAKRVLISVNDAGEVRSRSFDEEGAVLRDNSSAPIPGVVFGQWVAFRSTWLLFQEGAFAAVIIRVRGVRTNELVVFSDTAWASNGLHEVPVQLKIGLVGEHSRSHGHLYVNSTPVSLGLQDPLDGPEVTGFPGETASNRIVRIAAENNVPVTVVGPPGTTAMGPQPIDTVLDILRECAVADQGILYEPREVLELRYRTRADLYNQDPVLELDYTDGVFSSIPEPVDDDQLTRNDITVTRRGGSSARRRQVFGVLSVQPPPNGVGTYETSLTVNLAGDGQLLNDASWRLSLGTVDEPRFPSLALALHTEAFTE